MRIGVILASHGEFAQAALGAVEMIAGKQPDVIALGLTAEKSLESFESEMREAYETLSAECELVVTLCDIYGGTPFNVTTRCLLNGMNMVAYTGPAHARCGRAPARPRWPRFRRRGPCPAHCRSRRGPAGDQGSRSGRGGRRGRFGPLGSLARRFEWRSPVSPEWAPRSSRAFVNGTEGTCKRKGEHHGTQTRRHR